MIDFSTLNSAVLGVFAQPITIDDTLVQAVVDLRSGGRDIGGGMLVDRIEPSLTLATSTLATLEAKQGSVVIIDDKEYRVLAVLADDNGLTTLTLRPVK